MARLRGAVLTHNHPRGLEFPKDDARSLGNSFSPDDLRLACVAGLSELRVVTPRLRFRLRPPAGGWNETYWQATLEPAYARHELAVTQEFFRAIQRGERSVAEAESAFFHEICLRVSDELKLTYAREES